MKRLLVPVILGAALLYSSPSQAQDNQLTTDSQLTTGLMGESYVGAQQEHTLELDDEHFIKSGFIQRPTQDDILLELRLCKDLGAFDVYTGFLSRVSFGLDSHKALYATTGVEKNIELNDNLDFKARLELDVGTQTYLHPQVGFSFRF